jgi:hypothetical protein
MNNTIARFTIRSDGTIFIGVLRKTQSLLKPDMVYEIVDFLGEMVVREVGLSIIPSNNNDETEGKTFEFGNWNSDIGTIIGAAGTKMFLSRKEYESIEENNNE